VFPEPKKPRGMTRPTRKRAIKEVKEEGGLVGGSRAEEDVFKTSVLQRSKTGLDPSHVFDGVLPGVQTRRSAKPGAGPSARTEEPSTEGELEAADLGYSDEDEPLSLCEQRVVG